MALQPEGRVNAEARLLAGEVQLERGNFDDAGKAFKGVALLYDDPAITPRALDKAAVAFRQAGNNRGSRPPLARAARTLSELRQRVNTKDAWAIVHYSFSRYSFRTDAMPQGPSPT